MFHAFKYIFDIIIAVLITPIALPILIFTAILIKVTSPGPIFIIQKRKGRNDTYFNLYKFRSMQVDAPADVATHLLGNVDVHLTSIGGFLRKTSIDELPQLINILKGDMSFVGPRPALWNQFDLIEMRESLGVNAVRPGLTGLAQINGRDEISLEEKVRYDKEYVDNMSIWLDIRIVWGTIAVVFSGR